jgi:mannose-1-phosphate guanylyltransferase/mannose-6-phosphate isomerase
MESLFGIILAGGSGVRFWPYSRETWPKQMLDIVGEDSLLRQTIRRLDSLIPMENMLVVTTEKLGQDIQYHLSSLGKNAKRIKIIKEPLGKNTAPAIGLAAIYVKLFDPNAVMLVMPSDHLIKDAKSFQEQVKTAILGAEKDHLITFGIKPNKPETGYGYIKVKEEKEDLGSSFMKLGRFIEKPDLETAKIYLKEGNYFWNSGIFLWKASKILEEIEKYMPRLYQGLKVIEERLGVGGEQETIESVYAELESQSIDYGILEKSQDVLMIPASFDWSDVGSWAALDEVLDRGPKGNIVRGNVVEMDNENSLLFGSNRILAAIGLKDMVIIDTPDATLISPKDRTQEVRKIVDILKKNGREETLVHRTVERPWGNYTVLEKGDRYKIKRVEIKPNEKLSLQIHRHRSEHWVVVSGTAKVTRDNHVFYIHPNESTYIPVSTKHRLENPGRIPLQIIEVQNGDYLEEDDIERLDDEYGRS